jgi:hypothetical protein
MDAYPIVSGIPGHPIMTLEEASAMRQCLVDSWNWLTDRVLNCVATLCVKCILCCI